jgi:hypothetical protein
MTQKSEKMKGCFSFIDLVSKLRQGGPMQFTEHQVSPTPFKMSAKTQAHSHKHPHSKADRVGMILSALCVAHCLLLPVLILFLPMMARYYISHPLVHYTLALLVVPVGLYAFINGYLEHRRPVVLFVGLLGIVLVGFTPIAVHQFLLPVSESLLMVLGGLILVWAHWQNRRFCRSC